MKARIPIKGSYHVILLSLLSFLLGGPAIAQGISFDPVISTLTTYPSVSSALATDAAGNIYSVTDISAQVLKITPAGVTTIYAQISGLASRGIAVDVSTGNVIVYVADSFNNTIYKIAPNGTVTLFAGSSTSGYQDGAGANARFNLPQGLAADAAGNVYVADSQNHRIRKIDPNGNVSSVAGNGSYGNTNGTGTTAQFFAPTSLAVDKNGDIYVADYGNNLIRKILMPAGTVTTFAGDITKSAGFANGNGTNARFYGPTSIATDNFNFIGDMYVADTYNNVIRKITSSGVVTTLAGDPVAAPGYVDGTLASARFSQPLAVAVGPNSTVYSGAGTTPSLALRKISLPVLGAFAGTYGTPSASQSFTVSGTSLGTTNITVNAPTGYEVSLSAAGGYAASVLVTPTAGTVSSVPIYIRLGTVVGTYNGLPQIFSGFANSQKLPALSGIVSAKTITVTPDANQSKVYGGLEPGTFSYAAPGLVGTDVLTGSLTRNGGESVGNYAIIKGSLGNGNTINYNVIVATGVNFTITPKPVTITGVTAAGKIYDGSTTATLTAGTLTGVIAPDAVGINAGSGTFSDKNTGNKTVTVSGYTLNGTAAGNYILSAQPVVSNATISPKALTITGLGISNKVYDRTTIAALNGTPGISGVVGSEDVTLAIGNVASSFNDANVGSNKSVSLTGFTLIGTQYSNYTLNPITGLTASITPKQLTITGVATNGKQYDGNATASVSGGSLTGVIAPDNVTIATGTATYADKNAGTAKSVMYSGYTLTGTNATNYSVSQPAATTADITKAPLTVTAANRVKTYGTANPVLTGSYTGFVNGEDATVADGLPAYSTIATAESPAGSYPIITDLSKVSFMNYSVAGVNGTLTINKADQVISFYPLVDKAGTDAAFTVSATSDSGLPVTFTVSPATLATINTSNLVILTGTTGTVTVTATLEGDANHNAASDVPHTFEVNNKAKATISLSDFSASLGAPAFTPVVTSNSTGNFVFLILPGGTGAAIVNVNNKIVPTALGTVNVRVYVNSDANTNGNFIDVVMTVNKANQVIPALGLNASYEGTNADLILPASTDANLLITYSSSAPAIISVANNTLHFTGAAGSVTISANQAGDGMHNPAPLVTKTLCVVPAKPTIKADYTHLDAPVLTSSATAGNQWMLNEAAINGSVQQTHTVASAGVYSVQVTVNGCSSVSDDLTIIVTGVEKENINGLYPNPAINEINFTRAETGTLSIQIVDLAGKPVKQFTYTNGGTIKIDISDMTTGSYVLKAVQDNHIQNIHFIKK